MYFCLLACFKVLLLGKEITNILVALEINVRTSFTKYSKNYLFVCTNSILDEFTFILHINTPAHPSYQEDAMFGHQADPSSRA